MISLKDYLDFELNKKVVVKQIDNTVKNNNIKEGVVLYNSLVSPIIKNNHYYFFKEDEEKLIGVHFDDLNKIFVELKKND